MMKYRIFVASALTVCLGVLLAPPAKAQNAAHRHIAHVADRWSDTPDNMGLLATAQAEAEIAAQHAALAAKAEDKAGMERHIAHVLHALDPTTAERGPGKGYGFIKAATGVAQHIGLAAEASGASDAVKTHATHVGTSAENTVRWAEAIMEMAEKLGMAQDLEAAAKITGEIATMVEAIVSGTDADGDGRVSWGEGEGGLAQAATHLGLMKRAEGMN